MKKFILILIVLPVLAFSSCNKDDDGGAVADATVDTAQKITCITCKVEAIIAISTKYCDNGDGTVTGSFEGIEQTESLNGATFEQFIQGIEVAGAVCQKGLQSAFNLN